MDECLDASCHPLQDESEPQRRTHTPTPWHWEEDEAHGDSLCAASGKEVVMAGSFPGIDATSEDRAFIVRAVNAHEELLSALKIALRDHQQNDPHHNDMCDLCQMMTQAIAKAEGR